MSQEVDQSAVERLHSVLQGQSRLNYETLQLNISSRPQTDVVQLLTHQRLDVALDRMVVTAQVCHEAETWKDDVIIARLATRARGLLLVKGHKPSLIMEIMVECYLHVHHKKRDELLDVAAGLEDANVIRQFLQHLQALDIDKEDR